MVVFFHKYVVSNKMYFPTILGIVFDPLLEGYHLGVDALLEIRLVVKGE